MMHTRNQLYASNEGGNWRVMAVAKNGGYTIADMGCDDQEANAKRFVACWNACAGIPTDDLEACPERGLFYLASHADQPVKQRDDLFAKLDNLEGRATLAEVQRDELLTICRNVVERGIGASDVKAMKAAIASVNADKFRGATKKAAETSAPAIVFYPSGSLGEPIESEGGEA